MNRIAIIIPCYNEEKRLNKHLILNLIAETDVQLFLTNDGSTDNTLQIINEIAKEFSDRIHVLNFEKNSGKAGVIYKSVNQISKDNGYDFIGYFDADFSTPVAEVKRMLDELNSYKYDFIFGSRIKLLNSKIKRKIYRHYIGRIVVTIINFKFKLSIYDTQCGAKIFSNKLIENAFNKPFYTSWLFDVEVFIRLKQQQLLTQGKEFPLTEWTDVEGSKLKPTHAFKIFKEIALLYQKY